MRLFSAFKGLFKGISIVEGDVGVEVVKYRGISGYGYEVRYKQTMGEGGAYGLVKIYAEQGYEVRMVKIKIEPKADEENNI